MTAFTVKVSNDGTVTIPAEIRRHLRLVAGDSLIFVPRDDGTVELRKNRYPTVRSLAGSAGKSNRPMSKQEMLDIARADALAEKYPRDT